MNRHPHRSVRALERELERPARSVFDETELADLPEPARRMFRATIAPGTPIAASARIEMRGEIRLRRWTRFTARETLAPLTGFVWSARAGPITGYDRYANGEGELRWELLGLVPVVRSTGADVARSSAGRAAAEAIWLPTALLPRFGVSWLAADRHRLTARLRVDAHDLEVHYELDEAARVRACWLDRWGDPDSTGVHGLHPFGTEADAHRTFAGLTIPSRGRAGWHYGSDRWEDGVFFRYEIADLRPAGLAG